MLPKFPPFDYTDPPVLNQKLHEALPRFHHLIYDTVMETASTHGLTVYLVGGIVRDLLLGRPNFDLDFVCLDTSAEYLASVLLEIFQALSEIESVKLTEHERFGTVRFDLTFHDQTEIHLDIATARLEIYLQPAALPTVMLLVSLQEDLLRRDFTINALALTPVTNGLRLTDPFNGLADLKAGWLRVLHPLSFQDDPTRILRGVRFAARFGYKFEPITAQLLQEAIAKKFLARLSPERIRNELRAILREARPEIALQLLQDYRILEAINPLLSWNDELSAEFRELRQFLTGKISSAAYLALLTYRLEPVQAEKVIGGLHFDKNEYQTPVQVAQLWHKIRPELQQSLRNSHLYALLYLFDPYTLEVFSALLQLKNLGEAAAKVAFYLSNLKDKKPQLGGDYLIKAGLKPGPAFRTILNDLRDHVLDDEIRTRADEEAFLQSKINR